MLWADLRDELADLYPDKANSERVTADALLSVRYLDFEGVPVDVWDRIMLEADRHGKMLDLLRVVEHEYPKKPKVKIARVVLESGGLLRDAPDREYERMAPPNRDVTIDVILDGLNAVRRQIERLDEKSEERGEKLRAEVSTVRHDLRDERAFLRPIVESNRIQLAAHAAQLEAHGSQLKAQATQLLQHAEQMGKQDERLDVQGKSIKALEERPEVYLNKSVLWIALAVGLIAALGADVLGALIRSWFGG